MMGAAHPSADDLANWQALGRYEQMLYYINGHWARLPEDLTAELYVIMDRAVARHHSTRPHLDRAAGSESKSTMLRVTEDAEEQYK